jgi:FkbM family methyltransferase
MKHLYCIALFFLAASSTCRAVSYAQYRQDEYVNEHFFKNKREGVFVDIGASDGVLINNTYFFEKELGWTGICVEPRPDKFVELRKNRDCICINGCIADAEGQQPFLFLKGYTGDLSGLAVHYDQQHIDRISNELNYYGGEHQMMHVQCYRLDTILQDYGISHIDYLSIDTEGSELAILKSVNFKDITIDVIDVENNYNGSLIADFLQEQGYELVERVGCDEIYKRRDYAERTESLS